MSEKVKVKKEVGDLLENLLHESSPDEILYSHAYGDKWVSDHIGNDATILNSLSVVQLARALYIGYEVEEEFGIGDTVINKQTNEILEIDGFMLSKMDIWKNNFRHATEQEIAQEKKRRFWNGIGREVDEYRKGDIVFNETQKMVYQVISDEFRPGSVNDYKLVCPVENRLDNAN